MSSKTRLAMTFLLSQRLAAESLEASGRSSWPAAHKLIPAARRTIQYCVSRMWKEISEIIGALRNKKQRWRWLVPRQQIKEQPEPVDLTLSIDEALLHELDFLGLAIRLFRRRHRSSHRNRRG